VPSPQARADHLAERFVAAGFTPRVTDQSGYLCVETEVSDAISAASWQELLALLEAADWFGLVDSAERGRTAWAAVSKETPATLHHVRGHGHQL